MTAVELAAAVLVKIQTAFPEPREAAARVALLGCVKVTLELAAEVAAEAEAAGEPPAGAIRAVVALL